MIDLSRLKAHLRVTHSSEDDLIQVYLDAATELVSEYLGGDSNTPESWMTADAPIDAAVLLLAADLYLNRERQGRDVFNQNPTYALLLAPYRDLVAQ